MANRPHNLEVAHRLASAGLPVLPVDAAKRAALPDWPNAASVDAAKIVEWFGGPSSYAPAIALEKTDLVVIDLDQHSDGPDGVAAFTKLAKENGGVPAEAPVIRTPSGGMHLYFKHPNGERIRNSASRIGPGIDVRGDGGYVVAPGARLGEGREYVPVLTRPDLIEAKNANAIPELPGWLASRARKPVAEAAVYSVAPPSDRYARAALEREIGTVATAPNGTRNHALNKAAYSLAQIVAAGALSQSEVEGGLMRAALAAGLPKGEALTTIRSGFSEGFKRPRAIPEREHNGREAPRDNAPGSARAEQAKVALIRGSTIKPEPINWLWLGWLAAGKCHVFGGAPGAGKTTISGDLAATVSRGGLWPDGTRASAGNVVIWSGEDDPKDTLAPRLIAAGADMSRVFFVGDVYEAGKVRAFDPAKDIVPLQSAISEAGGVSLLIVDPLVSAIAGDSHKNAEVRRALQPLVDLATKEGAALLGITHFSKGTAGREPTERITGSLAFGALARMVLIAAKVPGEGEDDLPKRIFMRAKSNIGPDDGGFEYDLRQVDLDSYPGLSASRVEWGARIDGTAREVLREAEAEPDRVESALSKAVAFLCDTLADGPVKATEVSEKAEAANIAPATLRRAKEKLGVAVTRQGFGSSGSSYWGLPSHTCSKNPIGAQQKEVSKYGNHEQVWSESSALSVDGDESVEVEF